EAQAAVQEEEEINRFEAGVHPDQHQIPENQPDPGAPLYTHSVNELAAMLHSMEIAQYSEAMSYRATFPTPTFGTLYPEDSEWQAHQAREMASFQARQSYNSSLRTTELSEIARR
ncbi:hypothetical protein A2U01_0063907, partial [Trifolium medium]|nr:hypothetical protein [Trifolium medium]